MKTYLAYGFFLTLGTFLVRVVLFLCGMQSDASKIPVDQWIDGFAGFAIAATLIVCGIKSRRTGFPAAKDFGYGDAFTAGWLVQLFASLFSIVTTYVFFAFINPGFNDMMIQHRLDKLQERGVSGDQLDRAERMMRMFANPTVQAISAFFGTLIFGTIIVLVAAAFLKRRAVLEAPPVVG